MILKTGYNKAKIKINNTFNRVLLEVLVLTPNQSNVLPWSFSIFTNNINVFDFYEHLFYVNYLT